jgi:hypothetical protein
LVRGHARVLCLTKAGDEPCPQITGSPTRGTDHPVVDLKKKLNAGAWQIIQTTGVASCYLNCPVHGKSWVTGWYYPYSGCVTNGLVSWGAANWSWVLGANGQTPSGWVEWHTLQFPC